MAESAFAEIPFSATEASGLEPLAGAAPTMVNMLTDTSGATKMRPTVQTWASFPSVLPQTSPVDGMVPFGDNTLVYATRDRKLWSLNVLNGSNVALSSATLTTQLAGTAKPMLLPLRTKVVIVGGDAPETTDAVNPATRLGGSPPAATHAVGIATRVVLKVADASGIIRWSGLGDTGHSVWDALNFLEAEAKPDALRALWDNTNELFAFGAETLQVFSPDAVVGFAAGRTLNVGLLAAYSVVRVDDLFAFLDREKRFVLTDGRSFGPDNVISLPIESDLRAIDTVSDCFGFRMKTDRWDACVWFFPTSGRGFVYDLRGQRWSEWRSWNMATGEYAPPNITSAVAWPERNLFLVGLSTGQIAQLGIGTGSDLGTTVKVELVTGFVDHGTDNQKQHVQSVFTFKRGQAAQDSAAPQVLVSWRDDTDSYVPPRIFTLGTGGDYVSDIPLRSTGVYRRRQWKVEFTSAADFTFMGAREEFRVLNT